MGRKTASLERKADAPKKDDIKAIEKYDSANADSQRCENRPPPFSVVEVRFPSAADKEARAHKKREQRRDRWKVLLEALTLLVVLGYGYVADRQWGAMLDANQMSNTAALAAKESADAAVAASRAWMVPAGTEADGPSSVTLYFKNAGKSPAIHVVGTAEDAMQWPPKLREGCAALKNHEINGWTKSQPLVLPNEPFTIPLQRVPPEWTQPLQPEHARTMHIHGCVWYLDVLSNQERSTEFCYSAIHQKFVKAPEVVIIPSPCLTHGEVTDSFLFR